MLSIQGLDVKDTVAFVNRQLWPLTLALWKYFPAIQLVVYRLFPAPLWPLIFNLIGLLFGIFVNYTSSRRVRPAK